MSSFRLRLLKIAAVCLLGVFPVLAQDWKTSGELPGIDLSTLTVAQKTSVLKVLRNQDCYCACGMKVAECRVKDPSCSYSSGLAAVVIESIKGGKSEADALAAANNSKWAHTQPTKILDDAVKIPVTGAPSTGPANAPVTIVEFSDFQCPYCVAAVPELDAVLKAYPKQVRLIFKQFPLEMHSQADLAATAAVASNLQGKFWAMHDALFAHHNDLSREAIDSAAKQTGLDMNRFEKDITSQQVRDTVVRDEQDGSSAGVQGTPTIFLNGQRYNGPIDLKYLKLVLDAELKHQAAPKQSASVVR